MAAGDFLGIHETTEWINFLAMVGSGILTFLAGAEIDPKSLRTNLKASVLIGTASFATPFIGVWMFAQRVMGKMEASSLADLVRMAEKLGANG